MMMNRQEQFRANLDVSLGKHIEGFRNDARDGILNRGNSVIGMPALDSEKNILNRFFPLHIGASPERLEGGAVAERAFRSPIAHGERLLGRSSGANNLAEDSF